MINILRYVSPNKYSILVYIDDRTLILFYDKEIIKSYPVAVGKPSTPTPIGTFEIINKAIEPGGPYGVRWLGLNYPHIGIHGTNNPSSIGKASSEGCIRMYNEDVLELSNKVPIGTVVKIVQHKNSD